MSNTHNISKQLEEQAQKGIAAAQYQLGLAYEAGDGVPKNDKKAFEWMRESAKQGYGKALCQLGVYYMKGIFIEKSETLAVYYFNQALQKGVSEAHNYMGVCYELGFGVTPSKEKAFYFYEKAAKEGVSEAIASYNRLKASVMDTSVEDSDLNPNDGENYFNLAEDYYYGENGRPVDQKEAVRWYKQAAHLNHADAQFSLGYCYAHGEGIGESAQDAVYWFRKGAENGSADAQCALGECYYNGEGVSEDAEKAFYWFNKAAEQDNATACFYMGECYENGYGCSVDKKKALQYYLKAKDLGDEGAEEALSRFEPLAKKTSPQGSTNKEQSTGNSNLKDPKGDEYFDLGKKYYYGEHGRFVDYEEAVRWYQEAAKLNHADGQFWLGLCYMRGEGVVRDEKQAISWFHKSAENGNVDAQYRLGECYYKGIGVKQSFETAISWLAKAAKQNNAKACYLLGECYENGTGCVADKKLAKQYYLKAKELGDDEAEEALSRLGIPIQATTPQVTAKYVQNPSSFSEVLMTCPEWENYSKLKSPSKELFEIIKVKYPHWDFDRVMKRVCTELAKRPSKLDDNSSEKSYGGISQNSDDSFLATLNKSQRKKFEALEEQAKEEFLFFRRAHRDWDFETLYMMTASVSGLVNGKVDSIENKRTSPKSDFGTSIGKINLTGEERDDYEKLSPEQKEFYLFTKSRHPQWTHLQCMTRTVLEFELIKSQFELIKSQYVV